MTPATAGWNAPAFAPWLEQSIHAGLRQIYGQEAVYHLGCGGIDSVHGDVGCAFPRTQFFITGVLGPQANAHGPNEFLHVEYAKKLTTCVSLVLADHASSFRRSAGALATPRISACAPCSWGSRLS